MEEKKFLENKKVVLKPVPNDRPNYPSYKYRINDGAINVIRIPVDRYGSYVVGQSAEDLNRYKMIDPLTEIKNFKLTLEAREYTFDLSKEKEHFIYHVLLVNHRVAPSKAKIKPEHLFYFEDIEAEAELKNKDRDVRIDLANKSKAVNAETHKRMLAVIGIETAGTLLTLRCESVGSKQD